MKAIKFSNFESFVDDAITYMECSDLKSKSWGKHDFSLKHFGRPILFDDNEDETSYFDSVTPADVNEHIDVSIIRRHKEARFQLTRFRQVTPRQVRGWAKRLAPKMFEKSEALVNDDGKFISARAIYGWSGAKFSRLDTRQDLNSEEKNQLSILPSIHLTHRYLWHVCIGYENSQMIRVPTDPSGIKEIFKLRDIPEGKSRREALRNWVMAHYRTIVKKNTDEEISIRAHLRGATDFTWGGFRVKIEPSQFDLERNAR